MALKYSLAIFLAAAAGAQAQNSDSEADYSDRVVEEVIVTARDWRKPKAPELPETPRWQITDETREKLGSRMQFGYDPVLEEIRNTDNRIKVRGNVREPEPVTIFRANF